MESSLTLFVWSKSRVTPVRITDLDITEEFFDPQLNPIHAKVSIGMRVLTAIFQSIDNAASLLEQRSFGRYHDSVCTFLLLEAV